MKLVSKIGATVLFIFIAIQWYRPYKNAQISSDYADLLISENAPKEVIALYRNACYDCHSNYTQYAWFDNIAPISWYVDSNIKEGKFVLNFSNWKNLTVIEKEIMFQAIPFDIDQEKMPKKKYTLFHPKATLSEENKQTMIAWLALVKTRFLSNEGADQTQD